ncbi:MAG: hypothetical protein AB7U59_07105 [Desulfovibrionaceae bacterium]
MGTGPGAARYGVSADLAVFNLAYALPGLLGLLLDGAVIAAFVPLYVDWRRNKSPDELRNCSLTVCLTCLGGSVALEGTAAALAALLRAWKAFAVVTAAQLPINIA